MTIDSSHNPVSFSISPPSHRSEVEKQNLPVSYVDNKDVLALAADFLHVSHEGLEKALCTKATLTRGETIISPLSSSAARDVCDAFVKGIYGRQFIWIVNKINRAIYKPKVLRIWLMNRYSSI